jgi:hypothetical protein
MQRQCPSEPCGNHCLLPLSDHLSLGRFAAFHVAVLHTFCLQFSHRIVETRDANPIAPLQPVPHCAMQHEQLSLDEATGSRRQGPLVPLHGKQPPTPLTYTRPPPSFCNQRFIQCRGRARRPGSRFMLLLPRGGSPAACRTRQGLVCLEE